MQHNPKQVSKHLNNNLRVIVYTPYKTEIDGNYYKGERGNMGQSKKLNIKMGKSKRAADQDTVC